MIDILYFIGETELSGEKILELSKDAVLYTPRDEKKDGLRSSTDKISKDIEYILGKWDTLYFDTRYLSVTDFGMSILSSLGASFFDSEGIKLKPIAKNLYKVDHMDLSQLPHNSGKTIRLILRKPKSNRRIEKSIEKILNPMQAELMERGYHNLRQKGKREYNLDFTADLKAQEGGGLSSVLTAFLKRDLLKYVFVEDLKEEANFSVNTIFINKKEILSHMKKESKDYKEKALELHEKNHGKIEVRSKTPLNSKDDLALLYTPGVAEPCKKIAEDEENVYRYTAKKNLVAVVTDGSAVLGLGNIGAKAGMPVMEGKAILFKHFGDVDAFPILIDSQDTDKIVETVKQISPTFGGINLEDISAPRCFEVEKRLIEELDIPVFHDDQHGTAVVVTAGIINALKLTGKKAEDVKIVINGCGAAGIAILKMMINLGARNILILDSKGIITKNDERNTPVKEEIANISNPDNIKGTLKDAVVDADIFIGVSVAGALTKEMVKSMNKDSIIFAMANPVPEIYPEEAKEAGARVVGTGRSDFPNQINNVLCFPGLFRGALDARAKKITEEMKMAAAHAIAEIVGDDLSEDYVIPDAMNMEIPKMVAKAVMDASKR